MKMLPPAKCGTGMDPPRAASPAAPTESEKQSERSAIEAFREVTPDASGQPNSLWAMEDWPECNYREGNGQDNSSYAVMGYFILSLHRVTVLLSS